MLRKTKEGELLHLCSKDGCPCAVLGNPDRLHDNKLENLGWIVRGGNVFYCPVHAVRALNETVTDLEERLGRVEKAST